jgi:hypothetical protein
MGFLGCVLWRLIFVDFRTIAIVTCLDIINALHACCKLLALGDLQQNTSIAVVSPNKPQILFKGYLHLE